MKNTVLWHVTACSVVECRRRFGRKKVMSYSSILRTEVQRSLETDVNLYHFLWLDITEGGRHVTHYSVCGLQKCLESIEMWCRRGKEKIICIGHVKNEEVGHYEGPRRSGMSKTQ
jgi:hypothetical protein